MGPSPLRPYAGVLKCLMLMSTFRDSTDIPRKKEQRLTTLQVYMKTRGILFTTQKVAVALGKH